MRGEEVWLAKKRNGTRSFDPDKFEQGEETEGTTSRSVSKHLEGGVDVFDESARGNQDELRTDRVESI
jgi:hypothetical protein